MTPLQNLHSFAVYISLLYSVFAMCCLPNIVLSFIKDKSKDNDDFIYKFFVSLSKLTSQVTYVTLVPRGNETLRRDARGTPSALSSSESYV